MTERVVHASADLEFADALLADEAALRAGREALLAGAPIVCDARMVAAGITRREAVVPLPTRAPRRWPAEGITRTAAAMRLAAARGPARRGLGGRQRAHGAVRAARAPAARRRRSIVGLPVGFVGAAEAKAALAASGLPCVANRGEKGGSAVAAAAVNALLYFDEGAA